MKRTLLFSVFQLAMLVPCYSQAPYFQWAQTSEMVTANQQAFKVASDGIGSVYMAGNNEKFATFGSVTIDSGNFIARYRHDGKFLWVRSIPGTIMAIETDQDGALYVAAVYDGAISIENTQLSSKGQQDFLIAKFDGSGHLLWLTSTGGSGTDKVYDISVGGDNYLNLAGEVTGPVTVGGYSVKDTGFFVSRFSPAGQVEWVVSKPSYTIDMWNEIVVWNRYPKAYEIETSSTGDIYVLSNRTASCYYCESYVLSKYNASGQLIRDTSLWGVFEYPGGLETDKDGNIFLMSNTGSHYTHDIVLGKFDPSLNLLWSRGLGNGYCNYAISSGITVDPDGNPTVTGWLGGSHYSQGDYVTLDSGFVFPARGSSSVVWQFSGASGKTRWVKAGGGKTNNSGDALCSDVYGNIYMALTTNRNPWSGSSPDPAADTCQFDNQVVAVKNGFGQAILTKIRTSDKEFGPDVAIQEHLTHIGKLTMMPNPGDGRLHFSYIKNNASGLLRVTDVSGRVVAERTSGDSADLTDMDAGVYYLRLITPDGAYTGTYIKQ